MNSTITNPAHWRLSTLLSLGNEQVHELARKANGTVTAYRLVTGRCLLALHENKGYKEFGCSCATHYGAAILGMSARTARDSKRVAHQLLGLGKITLEAERGRIDWSKLREIVRVACPETEEFWLAIAGNHNTETIRELVKRTPAGGLPGDVEESASFTTELRCKASPEFLETFKRAQRMLSLENEKALTGAETLEYLLAAFLSSRPVDAKVLEKVRDEADKDLRAEEARRIPEVIEARELAAEFGLIGEAESEEEEVEDSAELLAQALGGEVAVQPHCDDSSCGCDHSKRHTCVVSEAERLVLNRLVNSLKPWQNKSIRFKAKNRLTTKAQRQEILRRDGWCCSTPGCANVLWLEIHHIKPYSEGGETVSENLLGLCSGCHRNLHLGLLKITVKPDGTLIFADSQGRRLDRQADLELAGWIDFWQGWSGGEFDSHQARLHQGEWAVFG